MKMFKLLFILASLSGAVAFAADQVNCNQELNNNSQIFQLMSLVKNEVLGTVPKFCRNDEHEQLAEQNDSGEKSLSGFVDQLKKLNPNGKDTINIDFDNKEEREDILFNTFKMVILKKMWQQSSPDNQYSLLLSEQCSEYGLNRFPIQKGSEEFEKNIEKDKEKSLAAAKRVCSSISFDVITPYLSKDVLAEGLLNLKNVFPASFPKIVDSLCVFMKNQNELIWKDDRYASFAKPKVSLESSKEFSGWLKDLYKDISNKETLAAEKEKQEKIISNLNQENNYGMLDPYSMAPYLDEQNFYKEIYDKAQVKGKPEKKSVSLPDNDGMLLKKNSKGIFIVVPTKEFEKELKTIQLETEASIKIMATDMYSEAQATMKLTYEDYQVKGKGPQPAPVDGFPGYFVVKNKNGTYGYILNDEGKAEIEKIKKKQTEELKKPELQNKLKAMYELQQKYVDEDGKNYFPEDYGTGVIGKLPDGSYEIKGPKNQQNEKALKALALKLSANNTEIPTPSDNAGYVTIKGMDGTYDQIEYGDHKPSKWDEDFKKAGSDEEDEGTNGSVMKGQDEKMVTNLSYLLKDNIKKRYQGKTSDNSKLEQLSPEELTQLRNYTGNSFKEINSCLRESSCKEGQNKKISLIISALQKLKNNQSNPDKFSSDDYQILFRGARELPGVVKDGLDKNSKDFVLDKGFMSSTGEFNTAKSFSGGQGGYVFIMKTKSCVGISTMSYYNEEDEFLCPPGMKFKVTKKVDSEGVYIMEEESK